ncbi:Cytochrome b-c1 complex subunit 8 [Pseudocercospora fuligena]|uniref:Cytochrome b-c1 complex subunit 8 n=1 Tax=Pseudocercospora fuligena TaxID=685502 RepID=A0A8H6R6S9_9PEZI|nr:Cytochrome b-c1 complex subunit 8 [Pseudocercospora fuligena]
MQQKSWPRRQEWIRAQYIVYMSPSDSTLRRSTRTQRSRFSIQSIHPSPGVEDNQIQDGLILTTLSTDFAETEDPLTMGGGGGKVGPGLKDATDPFRLVKGEWGDPRSLRQKGIVTYGVSANRLRPLAGSFQAAVFNTFRRSRNQVLYWGVPAIIAYSAMEWAKERNEYLNSKPGRAEHEGE